MAANSPAYGASAGAVAYGGKAGVGAALAVNLILDEGRAEGLSTAALEGVRAVIEKAMARGLSDADYSSIYEAVDPAG